MDSERRTGRAAADQDRAALHARLRARLRDLTARIDPFPPFPGAMFAYGIEVPPPARGDHDAGCVILGNDGELYELRIGIDADQVALGGDHVAARHEELVPLELPADRLSRYVESAIGAAEAYLVASPRPASPPASPFASRSAQSETIDG